MIKQIKIFFLKCVVAMIIMDCIDDNDDLKAFDKELTIFLNQLIN